jgi:hypothetical protein
MKSSFFAKNDATRANQTGNRCSASTHSSYFAVFAVFVPVYQPVLSRSPRESWATSGSAIAKTARLQAVFLRCFAVFVVEIQKCTNGTVIGSGLGEVG